MVFWTSDDVCLLVAPFRIWFGSGCPRRILWFRFFDFESFFDFYKLDFWFASQTNNFGLFFDFCKLGLWFVFRTNNSELSFGFYELEFWSFSRKNGFGLFFNFSNCWTAFTALLLPFAVVDLPDDSWIDRRITNINFSHRFFTSFFISRENETVCKRKLYTSCVG